MEPIHRNYHKGQELIDALKEKYPGRSILHYALPNEPSYEGAVKMPLPYIVYHELGKVADAIVCTDSSLQHLTAGTNRNTTVIWGETRPEHFGYNFNKNICAKNVINSQPYFKPLGVSPSIVRMPSVKDVMNIVESNEAGVY
jgi:ADP-heptose:LPS heptosyltransferase